MIGFDPKFVVGPVFDADGNLTNADALDLRLSSESWAIDRGDVAYVEGVATDLAGNTRVERSWASTATVDIGAYEYQSTFTKTPETPSLVVTTNSDVVDNMDGLISLREAIWYAESDSSFGSTITFAPSLKGKTITLVAGELRTSQGIKIDASALYNASTQTPGITVNANQKSRVFCVSGGTADAPVALIGLTITGGNRASYGGGVYAGGTATFTNCAISGNTAEDGGGVYAGGTTTLTNCAISGNTAEDGGGVYAGGTATFTNCAISGNTANSGGGVYAGGTTTFTNCAISGNRANSGGGVYA